MVVAAAESAPLRGGATGRGLTVSRRHTLLRLPTSLPTTTTTEAEGAPWDGDANVVIRRLPRGYQVAAPHMMKAGGCPCSRSLGAVLGEMLVVDCGSAAKRAGSETQPPSPELHFKVASELQGSIRTGASTVHGRGSRQMPTVRPRERDGNPVWYGAPPPQHPPR